MSNIAKLQEARVLAGLYLSDIPTDRITATRSLIRARDVRLLALTIRCLQMADQRKAPERIRNLCDAVGNFI